MKKYREAFREFQRDYFKKALEESHQSVRELAKKVGMNRTHLYIILDKLGITPDTGRYRQGGNMAWKGLTDEKHSEH